MQKLNKYYQSSTSTYEVEVTEARKNKVRVAIYTEKAKYPVRLEEKIAGNYEAIADDAWQRYSRFLEKRLETIR